MLHKIHRFMYTHKKKVSEILKCQIPNCMCVCIKYKNFKRLIILWIVRFTATFWFIWKSIWPLHKFVSTAVAERQFPEMNTFGHRGWESFLIAVESNFLLRPKFNSEIIIQPLRLKRISHSSWNARGWITVESKI